MKDVTAHSTLHLYSLLYISFRDHISHNLKPSYPFPMILRLAFWMSFIIPLSPPALFIHLFLYIIIYFFMYYFFICLWVCHICHHWCHQSQDAQKRASYTTTYKFRDIFHALHGSSKALIYLESSFLVTFSKKYVLQMLEMWFKLRNQSETISQC